MIRRFLQLTCACLLVHLAATAVAEEPASAQRRAEMIERVDQVLAERWKHEEVQPSALADDSEFIRRVYLDLTGVIPRVADVRAFLADDDEQKRAKLIERLLNSPRYATHMANTWRQIMVPGGLDLEQLQSVAGVQNWLRRKFADNLRYDRIVDEFLVATGGGLAGPALYYTSLELKPEKLAGSTARIFLGLQIECAECHAHPFDHWKQEDFWGYAAFFARLSQENQQGPMNVTIEDRDTGEVTLPDTETVVLPRYPDGRLAKDDDVATRRELLSIWMSSRDNSYLKKAAVNRVWSHMFGRGLVEPVDDIGQHNPASHPELFDELTQYFVETGFDWKELLRTLANTKAYQRSSRTVGEPPAAELFAAMSIKTLSPEQLFDSLSRVVGSRMAEMPNFFAIQSNLFDQRRLAFVGKMQMRGSNATEFDAGVLQALTLLNGADITAATHNEQSSVLMALDSPLFDDRERLETLFLGTYSRFPTPEETTHLLEHIETADASGEAVGDVLWALLNSAEFTLNH